MNTYSDLVIALAGVCQSATIVPEFANKGTCNYPLYTVSVKSLFNTSPSSVVDVFGNLANIKTGLTVLDEILCSGQQRKQLDLMRYIFSAINIANKLRNNNEALTALSKRLLRIKSIHGALTDAVLFEHIDELSFSLAGAYADIVSPLTTKIKVTGKIECLQNPLTQAKVRTALFGCVRMAMLWYQMGGTRWQFIFSRKKLVRTVRELLTYA